MLAKELRTPRERLLFVISAVFSGMTWLLVLLSIVGVFYGVFIAGFILVGHALFLAYVTGNGVRVTARQLPDLHRRIEAAAQKLGLARPPEAYVLQAEGILNALATKLFARRFIIILSDLIDAAETASEGRGEERPREIDFIIGHEIGHIAAGHLTWMWFLAPSRILPWLGPAYSRACEYTCDLCGHAVVGDIEVSSRAIAVLAAGGRCARRMDLAEFVTQRENTRGFWLAVYELNASHPFLSKRVAALREHDQPGAAPVVGRNPLAYPVAPLFSPFIAGGGGGGASLLAIIAVIGIIAAIAIPNLLNAIQRSKQKRTMSDMRSIGAAVEGYRKANGKLPAADTMEALAAEIRTGDARPLTTRDGWLHSYSYVTWQEDEESPGPDSYAIVSAGKDGVVEHEDIVDYEGGPTRFFDCDIVYSNGSFFRFPEGLRGR